MEYRCPVCNALIDGKTDVCPLCHAEIKTEGALAYPPRAKKAKKYSVSFTLYYTLAAMVVTLLCVVINVYLHPSLPWWISAAISLVLIYFFIRHTLLGIRNLASKLTYISYAILTFIYGVAAIFQKTTIIDFVPYFALAFDVTVYAYVFSTYKKSKGHLLALLIGDVSCFIPLLVAALGGSTLVAPVVVAGIAFVAAVVTVCIFPKEIASEIRRFFAA